MLQSYSHPNKYFSKKPNLVRLTAACFLILMFPVLLSSQCLQWSPTANFPVCDLTPNDPEIWNDSWFKDSLTILSDLSESAFDYTFSIDHTGCTAPVVQFSLKMDLDQNGVYETVVSTASPQTPGEVQFGNLFGIGEAAVVDNRPVPSNQKYYFAVEQISQGNSVSAKLIWRSQANASPILPLLPLGKHILTVTADNGVQELTHEMEIVVSDCKKPTVVCINGISINLMQTGEVIMWVSDFVNYAEDNRTPTSQLKYGLRRKGAGTGFPLNPGGQPQDSIKLNCADLGLVAVEVWVKDQAGNADYCETYTFVTDMNQVCPPVNSPLLEYEPAVSCADIGKLMIKPGTFVSDFATNFLWSTGSTNTSIDILVNGVYTVDCYGPNGFNFQMQYEVTDVPQPCAYLSGKVSMDQAGNCTWQNNAPTLSGALIRITDGVGNTFFTQTDNGGNYLRRLSPGTYDLEVIPYNSLWTACPPVTLNLPNGASSQHLVLQPGAAPCPYLEISQSAPRLRRCFENVIAGSFTNTGSLTAENVYIELELDTALTLTSASLPFTPLGNHQYRLEVGTVPMGAQQFFTYNVQVSCAVPLGMTHCMTAKVLPDFGCDPLVNWSGASVKIEAECDTDSLRFEIKNIGNATMNSVVDYIVLEDIVMLRTGQAPPLPPNGSMKIAVPANGSTWRVEASQEIFHPGNNQPMLSVEGCSNGAAFSTGMINLFPQNDADPWIDILCMANIGSFDPNDKQGFPIGYGDLHQINRNTDLEYLIRFQNTGTDTAFTVIIRDTISTWLDFESLRPGPASHPYRVERYGNGQQIAFIFDNIFLPDSSVSQSQSQGFVSYNIRQKPGIPFGTDILNSAAIYFDFNAPVITNTTIHRVDTSFIVSVAAWEPSDPALILTCTPNPMAESTQLNLTGWNSDEKIMVKIINQRGQVVQALQTTGKTVQLHRGTLPSGIYFIHISNEHREAGTGKLIIR